MGFLPVILMGAYHCIIGIIVDGKTNGQVLCEVRRGEPWYKKSAIFFPNLPTFHTQKISKNLQKNYFFTPYLKTCFF